VQRLIDTNCIFDAEETSRLELKSPEQFYDYLRIGVMPNLFNEGFKKAKIVPFLRPYLQINMKTNETEHYINEGFNLLIGFKVTRQRIQWVKNKDSKWKGVLP